MENKESTNKKFIYATFAPADPCTGKCKDNACQIKAMNNHVVQDLAAFNVLLTKIPGSGRGTADEVPQQIKISDIKPVIESADCSSYIYFGAPNPDFATAKTSDIKFQIAEGPKPAGVVGYDVIVFKAIFKHLKPKGDYFFFYKGKTLDSNSVLQPTICFSVTIADGTTMYWDVSTHYPGIEETTL